MFGHRLINDRRRDANDADAHAASFNRERGIGEFAGVYPVTIAREQRMVQFRGELAHPIRTVSEIPMHRPCIKAQQVHGR